MGMDEGGALAVKKIIFYLLSIVILLYALHIVSIPLTLFTFLGGAIAIAIGFGAQNLLNNFISGVIILIERPIKPQDLVEVDGDLGRVANIGARCSTISLFSGVDILIPNSFFLEKKVINWTLSDKKNRTHVAVGVVYGSPVDQVMQFMEQTVKEHSRILEYPEPVTLFTEFGKNSLNFEIYFWIFMNNFMDRRVIESDVRKRIIELFNENGIVVAFPQRDVHLDTTKPLEVQVVTDMKKTAQTKLP
jgi:small-conductance mechanosensitive channel